MSFTVSLFSGSALDNQAFCAIVTSLLAMRGAFDSQPMQQWDEILKRDA